MTASVMDLRYRTKEVLRALEAREEIILTHRGITKGKIVSIPAKCSVTSSIATLAAIGMWNDQLEPVAEMVARLRKPRSC